MSGHEGGRGSGSVEERWERAEARSRTRRASSQRTSSRRRTRRALLLGGGHLAALSALAVAQPLFDLLGRNPEFFAVRGSAPRDIVVFALVLTFGPPMLLFALELLGALAHRKVGVALHLFFVGLLVALVVVQAGNHAVEESGFGVVPLAVLAGGVAAVAYARLSAARLVATVLTPVPLIVLGLFLFSSPVSRLVFVDEPDVEGGSIEASDPVVLIVFDELPTVSLMNSRGEIDASRFPSFASLAADSTWFRSATTVHPSTHRAVPAILTGRLVEPGQLPTLADHPKNLFTLLGGSYELRAVETLTHLCPADRCVGAETEPFSGRIGSLGEDLGVVYLHLVLPASQAERLPPVDETWQDFRGEDGNGEPEGRTQLLSAGARGAVKFARLIRPTQRPAFYFFHGMLPHVPWQFLPSGRRYVHDVRLVPGTVKHRWGRDEWLIRQGYQRHLLQLGYTDRALGVILDRLRAAGLYDRAAIVVTADHGLSFEPGQPRRLVTSENLEAMAFVPLLVKAPGQTEPRVSDSLARTVDIVPTIADLLGASLPWRADGRSLLDGGLPRDGQVALQSPDGRIDAAPLSELRARREQALARKTAWFGDGGGFDPVYRIGPNSKLIGEPVAALPVRESDVRVELNGASLFRAVDPRSSSIPSYVTGTIAGGDRRALNLAIAVNGEIAAVTRSYWSRGARFAALVPDSVLSPGKNDVRVYAVAGEPATTLVALPGAELAVALRDDPPRIEPSKGAPIPVESDSVEGEVRATLYRETVILRGWAADLAAKEPADQLIVFAGEESVYEGRAGNSDQRRYVRRFGFEGAGFRVELPLGLLPKPGAGAVRIFAVKDGVAAELAYVAEYPWMASGG